ncbi:MAG TPA: NADH-quinone oxidoreductase subunit NuoK [bacterium]|nr:NADH-quinone oxidoreductase subunit NuoK [bacterium]
MAPGLTHYLVVSALLFALGLFAVVTRRNGVAILMGIELMLNAANINLVAFNRFVAPGAMQGQIFALIVITLAACEAAVGLALVLTAYRTLETIYVDEINLMKW